MLKEYKKWIDAKIVEFHPYGQCENWCNEMLEVFPELRKVSGFYHCVSWGKREHWWLVDKAGNIVDPTVSQFPTINGYYEPWIGRKPEPTGKYVNCSAAYKESLRLSIRSYA